MADKKSWRFNTFNFLEAQNGWKFAGFELLLWLTVDVSSKVILNCDGLSQFLHCDILTLMSKF